MNVLPLPRTPLADRTKSALLGVVFPPRLLPPADGGLFIRAHCVLPGTHSCIDRKVYQLLRILAGVALANPELLNVDGGELWQERRKKIFPQHG